MTEEQFESPAGRTDRQRAMTHVGRAVEKGETQGFIEGPGRCRNQVDPRRFYPGHRGRRGDPLHPGLMYAKATYTVMQTRGPYTSYGFGIDTTMLGELMPLEVRESRVIGLKTFAALSRSK